MQFEKKLMCHFAYVHCIAEEDLNQHDCISLIDDNHNEIGIFLSKNADSTEFEVRINKKTPSETHYTFNTNIHLLRIVGNDEFNSIFFDDFITARHFFSVEGNTQKC